MTLLLLQSIVTYFYFCDLFNFFLCFTKNLLVFFFIIIYFIKNYVVNAWLFHYLFLIFFTSTAVFFTLHYKVKFVKTFNVVIK